MQLIMLTGPHVEEIARLHVDQWDARERIIDWSKTKNEQPHAVPVPSLAAELIESIKPNEQFTGDLHDRVALRGGIDPTSPAKWLLREKPAPKQFVPAQIAHFYQSTSV